MVELNKGNIPEEYKWFSEKLNDEFKLTIGDKSKVIFGYNVIGKTTLFKILKSKYLEETEFLTYEEKAIIKESELKLSYFILEIDKLNKEINDIKSKLNIKDKLKANGLSNTAIRDKVNGDLDKFFKKGSFPQLRTTTKRVEEFNYKYPKLDMKLFFTCFSELTDVERAEKEIEKYNQSKLYIALKSIENTVTTQQTNCPICDTDTDWQTKLNQKIQQLEQVNSKLLEKYKKETKSDDANIPLEQLNYQISAFKDLQNDKDLLFDLAIAPSPQQHKEILDMQNLLNEKERKLNSYLNVAKEKYEFVLKKKKNLENDFKRYFGNTKISYDDKNFVISIKLPRKIESYSTGEINLLTFLYEIYSFLGSDKKTLILDDPVSSLDLINHYKIAFEIVNNVSADKCMVVLTHSVDFLNIINSQYPGLFDFLYLEECNNKIYLDAIEQKSASSNPNIITIEKIECENSNILLNYLKNRDTGECEFEEFLHYTPEVKTIGEKNKISNCQLIDLIDKFNSFEHKDFYENSYNKIKYLISIRLWIEKQLYLKIENDEKNKQKFLKSHTLEQRVSIVYPRTKNMTLENNKITREQIMSKKVMLNQGIHYNSQIAPFAYAINLSLDDLNKEINSIKQMFSEENEVRNELGQI